MNTLNDHRKSNLKQFFMVKKVIWCPVLLSSRIYFRFTHFNCGI